MRRAFELRATDVELDATAERFMRDCAAAHDPAGRQRARRPRRREYGDKIARSRADNDLPDEADVIFVEVTVTDPSDFEADLEVHGEVQHGARRVLTLESSSVPNTSPRCCCTSATAPASARTSTSSGPRATRSTQFLRFLFFGLGEVAPVTREVLRRAEPDRDRRPRVHVDRYRTPALTRPRRLVDDGSGRAARAATGRSGREQATSTGPMR